MAWIFIPSGAGRPKINPDQVFVVRADESTVLDLVGRNFTDTDKPGRPQLDDGYVIVVYDENDPADQSLDFSDIEISKFISETSSTGKWFFYSSPDAPLQERLFRLKKPNLLRKDGSLESESKQLSETFSLRFQYPLSKANRLTYVDSQQYFNQSVDQFHTIKEVSDSLISGTSTENNQLVFSKVFSIDAPLGCTSFRLSQDSSGVVPLVSPCNLYATLVSPTGVQSTYSYYTGNTIDINITEGVVGEYSLILEFIVPSLGSSYNLPPFYAVAVEGVHGLIKEVGKESSSFVSPSLSGDIGVANFFSSTLSVTTNASANRIILASNNEYYNSSLNNIEVDDYLRVKGTTPTGVYFDVNINQSDINDNPTGEQYILTNEIPMEVGDYEFTIEGINSRGEAYSTTDIYLIVQDSTADPRRLGAHLVTTALAGTDPEYTFLDTVVNIEVTADTYDLLVVSNEEYPNPASVNDYLVVTVDTPTQGQHVFDFLANDSDGNPLGEQLSLGSLLPPLELGSYQIRIEAKNKHSYSYSSSALYIMATKVVREKPATSVEEVINHDNKLVIPSGETVSIEIGGSGFMSEVTPDDFPVADIVRTFDSGSNSENISVILETRPDEHPKKVSYDFTGIAVVETDVWELSLEKTSGAGLTTVSYVVGAGDSSEVDIIDGLLGSLTTEGGFDTRYSIYREDLSLVVEVKYVNDFLPTPLYGTTSIKDSTTIWPNLSNEVIDTYNKNRLVWSFDSTPAYDVVKEAYIGTYQDSGMYVTDAEDPTLITSDGPSERLSSFPIEIELGSPRVDLSSPQNFSVVAGRESEFQLSGQYLNFIVGKSYTYPSYFYQDVIESTEDALYYTVSSIAGYDTGLSISNPLSLELADTSGLHDVLENVFAEWSSSISSRIRDKIGNCNYRLSFVGLDDDTSLNSKNNEAPDIRLSLVDLNNTTLSSSASSSDTSINVVDGSSFTVGQSIIVADDASGTNAEVAVVGAVVANVLQLESGLSSGHPIGSIVVGDNTTVVRLVQKSNTKRLRIDLGIDRVAFLFSSSSPSSVEFDINYILNQALLKSLGSSSNTDPSSVIYAGTPIGSTWISLSDIDLEVLDNVYKNAVSELTLVEVDVNGDPIAPGKGFLSNDAVFATVQDSTANAFIEVNSDPFYQGSAVDKYFRVFGKSGISVDKFGITINPPIPQLNGERTYIVPPVADFELTIDGKDFLGTESFSLLDPSQGSISLESSTRDALVFNVASNDDTYRNTLGDLESPEGEVVNKSTSFAMLTSPPSLVPGQIFLSPVAGEPATITLEGDFYQDPTEFKIGGANSYYIEGDTSDLDISSIEYGDSIGDKERSLLTIPTDNPVFGKYFIFNDGDSDICIWFRKTDHYSNDANVYTVRVPISRGDTPSQVASKTKDALEGIPSFSAILTCSLSVDTLDFTYVNTGSVPLGSVNTSNFLNYYIKTKGNETTQQVVSIKAVGFEEGDLHEKSWYLALGSDKKINFYYELDNNPFKPNLVGISNYQAISLTQGDSTSLSAIQDRLDSFMDSKGFTTSLVADSIIIESKTIKPFTSHTRGLPSSKTNLPIYLESGNVTPSRTSVEFNAPSMVDGSLYQKSFTIKSSSEDLYQLWFDVVGTKKPELDRIFITVDLEDKDYTSTEVAIETIKALKTYENYEDTFTASIDRGDATSFFITNAAPGVPLNPTDSVESGFTLEQYYEGRLSSPSYNRIIPTADVGGNLHGKSFYLIDSESNEVEIVLAEENTPLTSSGFIVSYPQGASIETLSSLLTDFINDNTVFTARKTTDYLEVTLVESGTGVTFRSVDDSTGFTFIESAVSSLEELSETTRITSLPNTNGSLRGKYFFISTPFEDFAIYYNVSFTSSEPGDVLGTLQSVGLSYNDDNLTVARVIAETITNDVPGVSAYSTGSTVKAVYDTYTNIVSPVTEHTSEITDVLVTPSSGASTAAVHKIEVTNATLPLDIVLDTGDSLYYIWFNVAGEGRTPDNPLNATEIEIAVGETDSPTTVAGNTASAINSITGITSSNTGGLISISTDDNKEVSLIIGDVVTSAQDIGSNPDFEVSTVLTREDSSSDLSGKYFLLYPNSTSSSYVWFNVLETDPVGKTPSLSSKTGLKIDVNLGATSDSLSNLIKSSLEATGEFSVDTNSSKAIITNKSVGSAGNISSSAEGVAVSTLSEGSGNKEVSEVELGHFLSGKYVSLEKNTISGLVTTDFWFNTGSSTAPTTGNALVEVSILPTDNISTIASKLSQALVNTGDFSVVTTGDSLEITNSVGGAVSNIDSSGISSNSTTTLEGADAVSEITDITFPDDSSGNLAGSFILFSSVGVEYYLWMNITSQDPSVPSRTGVEVEINYQDSEEEVITALRASLDAEGFNTTISNFKELIIESSVVGSQNTIDSGDSGSVVTVLREGFNSVQARTLLLEFLDDQSGSYTGTWFDLDSPVDSTLYSVWFNVGGGQTAPAISGISVEVVIPQDSPKEYIATAVKTALSSIPSSPFLARDDLGLGEVEIYNSDYKTRNTLDVCAFIDHGTSASNSNLDYNLDAVAELSSISLTSLDLSSKYFLLSNGNTDYYVWFNVNQDPNIVGRTGLRVDISENILGSDIRALAQSVVDSNADLTGVEGSAPNILRVTSLTNFTQGAVISATEEGKDLSTGFSFSKLVDGVPGDHNKIKVVTVGDTNKSLTGSYFNLEGYSTPYYVWFNCTEDSRNDSNDSSNTYIKVSVTKRNSVGETLDSLVSAINSIDALIASREDNLITVEIRDFSDITTHSYNNSELLNFSIDQYAEKTYWYSESKFTCPSNTGGQLQSTYFDFNDLENTYRIWINNSGGGTAPDGTGVTLIEVNFAGIETPSQIANGINAKLNTLGTISSRVEGGDSLVLTSVNNSTLDSNSNRVVTDISFGLTNLTYLPKTYVGQSEIVSFNGADITESGSSITLATASHLYHFWFNIEGVDPNIIGRTGIEINYPEDCKAEVVCESIIDGLTNYPFEAGVLGDFSDTLIITNTHPDNSYEGVVLDAPSEGLDLSTGFPVMTTEVGEDSARAVYTILYNSDEADSLNGTYMRIPTPVNDIYVWYNTGTGVDPAPGGQGFQISINTNDDAYAVAQKTGSFLQATGLYTVSADYLTVSPVASGETSGWGSGTTGFDVIGTYSRGVDGAQEIVDLEFKGDIDSSLGGKYFNLYGADGSNRKMWFNPQAQDPSIAGKTGVSVSVSPQLLLEDLQSSLKSSLESTGDFQVEVVEGGVLVGNINSGDPTDPDTSFLSEVDHTVLPLVSENASFRFTTDYLSGKYILLSSDSAEYYVWFNTGSSVDPAVTGKTGIKVTIDQGADNDSIALAVRDALSAYFPTSLSGNLLTLSSSSSLTRPVLGTLSTSDNPTYVRGNTEEYGEVVLRADNLNDLNSKYFTIETSTDSYYVWYHVLGQSETNPSPVGYTNGIKVSINTGENIWGVTHKTKLQIEANYPAEFSVDYKYSKLIVSPLASNLVEITDGDLSSKFTTTRLVSQVVRFSAPLYDHDGLIGKYFKLVTNVTDYYIWFDSSGASVVDPMGGTVAIRVVLDPNSEDEYPLLEMGDAFNRSHLGSLGTLSFVEGDFILSNYSSELITGFTSGTTSMSLVNIDNTSTTKFVSNLLIESDLNSSEYFVLDHPTGPAGGFVLWLNMFNNGIRPDIAGSELVEVVVDSDQWNRSEEIILSMLDAINSIPDSPFLASYIKSEDCIEIHPLPYNLGDGEGPLSNPVYNGNLAISNVFPIDDFLVTYAFHTNGLRGKSFNLSSPGIITDVLDNDTSTNLDFYIWFNDGFCIDPNKAGTGIEVSISSTDSPSIVADKVSSALDSNINFLSYYINDEVFVECSSLGYTKDPVFTGSGLSVNTITSSGKYRNTECYEMSLAVGLLGSKYFYISSPSTDYYVWFDYSEDFNAPVSGTGSEVKIDILVGDSGDAVATKVGAVIDGFAGTPFSTNVETGSTLRVTNNIWGVVTLSGEVN